jgi:hypothetical protein
MNANKVYPEIIGKVKTENNACLHGSLSQRSLDIGKFQILNSKISGWWLDQNLTF